MAFRALIVGLFVLVMAHITVSLAAVVPRVMRICRLDIRGFHRQILGTMAAHALVHFNWFVISLSGQFKGHDRISPIHCYD
jgi:uncharacterized membrane protein YvlD (DUF360 family)